jgi:NAD(P)-dependent dehydrogenase (short-subunit alcohol dehydrogenase family)
MSFAAYPSLTGRRAFVTGGATGIGAAIVAAFHAQGAVVAFVDRDATAGEALAVGHAGTRFQALDVTAPGALEAAVEARAQAMGGLDILVNNVADDTRHAAAETGAAQWRATLAVNLDPAFLAARAAYPFLKSSGVGAIINLSSINALTGPANLAAYAAAKGAINALTKSLAREWGPDRIRVNAVSPGWVVTERQLKLWLTPEAEVEWMRGVALPDRIEPDDVARLVLFLASDDSRRITGQNLIVDGGRT